MKTLPPTAQRRQTPSWQPPPPQRRLFFYRALPLLGVESSPRIFTEPAFCEPPPRPLRGLSDTPHRLRDQLRAEPLGWYGGQFLSRTVLATLSSFRRSYFPLSQHSKLKRLPGNCVWIKPHLKEKGGNEKSLRSELPSPFSLATACLSPNPTASLPVAKEILASRMRPTFFSAATPSNGGGGRP